MRHEIITSLLEYLFLFPVLKRQIRLLLSSTGGTLSSSLKTLYDEGGISRLYQGLPFALIQVRFREHCAMLIVPPSLPIVFLTSSSYFLLPGTANEIWGYGSKRRSLSSARKYSRNCVIAAPSQVRRQLIYCFCFISVEYLIKFVLTIFCLFV